MDETKPRMTAMEHVREAERLVHVTQEDQAAGSAWRRLRMAELHVQLANAIKTHEVSDLALAQQQHAIDVMDEEDERSRPKHTMLIVEWKEPGAEQQRVVLDQNSRVGKSGSGAVIQLPDEYVSSPGHAAFILEDGRWRVEDLGSTNGTYVNGRKTYKQALGRGDKVRIGHTTLTITPA